MQVSDNMSSKKFIEFGDVIFQKNNNQSQSDNHTLVKNCDYSYQMIALLVDRSKNLFHQFEKLCKLSINSENHEYNINYIRSLYKTNRKIKKKKCYCRKSPNCNCLNIIKSQIQKNQNKINNEIQEILKKSEEDETLTIKSTSILSVFSNYREITTFLKKYRYKVILPLISSFQISQKYYKVLECKNNKKLIFVCFDEFILFLENKDISVLGIYQHVPEIYMKNITLDNDKDHEGRKIIKSLKERDLFVYNPNSQSINLYRQDKKKIYIHTCSFNINNNFNLNVKNLKECLPLTAFEPFMNNVNIIEVLFSDSKGNIYRGQQNITQCEYKKINILNHNEQKKFTQIHSINHKDFILATEQEVYLLRSCSSCYELEKLMTKNILELQNESKLNYFENFHIEIFEHLVFIKHQQEKIIQIYYPSKYFKNRIAIFKYNEKDSRSLIDFTIHKTAGDILLLFDCGEDHIYQIMRIKISLFLKK